VRVSGPDEPEVRYRAQRSVVLDRLVRGAVLAEADRVVRPGPDDGKVPESRQADGRAHVVREDEERRAVGLDDAAVEGKPVDDRAHPVLPDAKGDIAARMGGREDARSLELGLRGLDQVG